MFKRVGETSREFKIDPELKAVIPALLPDERKQLEANILEFGCLDPLKVWDEESLLIDGHNRYEICELHDIKYGIERVSFEYRDAVIDWMIDNQLGRRNLTREQQKYLRGLQYNREKAKSPGAPVGNGNAEKQCPDFQDIVLEKPVAPKRTADRLAEQHKVSRDTIERDGKFAESLDTIANVAGPAIKDAILSRQTYATEQDVKAIADAARTTPDLVQKLVQKQQEEKGSINAKVLSNELRQQKQTSQQQANADNWTPAQLERRGIIEAGGSVVCNMQGVQDAALIAWAKERGLFARIDRASDFGNPFILPDDGSRDEVCDWFAEYFSHKRSLHSKLSTLNGRALGCWCYPERCHGDELIRFINEDNSHDS